MKEQQKKDINRNVTFSVSKEIYKRYIKFCKHKGFVASRRIEIFMEKEMEK